MTMFLSGSLTSSGSLGALHALGRVGIGTKSPDYNLEVVDTGFNAIGISRSGYQDAKIGITNVGGSGDQALEFDANAYEFRVDGTAGKLVLLNNGNVGIGTTSPSTTRRLHIYNTDDTRGIYIENTSATSYAELHLKANREFRVGTGGSSSASEAQNRFYVYDATAAAHRFTIDSSGKVGIGTTSPSANLAISGSGDSTSNELSIESDVYPILRFKSYGNNANNREFRFASVYNTYGKFEILSATNNTGAATTTRLSISGTTGDIEFPTANAKLSGSATSTGSFGELHIADKVGIGTTSPDRLLTLVGSTAAMNIDSAGNAFIHLDRGAVNDIGEIVFRTAGANKWFVGMTDSGNYSDGSEFYIGESSGASSDRHFIIDTSGNIEFQAANAKISGSATSTGSFGVVNVNGAVIQNPDDVLNISSNAATNINVQTTNTNSSTGILFSDTSRSRGMVLYQHGSDTLQFRAGGITVAETTSTMAISGSSTSTGSFGNIIVGKGAGKLQLHADNASNLNEFILIRPGGTSSVFSGIGLGDGNGDFIIFADRDNASNGNIIFQEGGTERMRIDSSGKVGIGNTTPGSYEGSRNDLVVGSGGNSGITIVTGTSHTGLLVFADGTSGDQAYRGQIYYSHSSELMGLSTNGTTVRQQWTSTATEFPTANYKISGSATSTGSFGSVVSSDNISIGTSTLGGDQAAKLFIFEDDSSFGNTGIHIENAKADDAAVIVLEGARTSENDTAQIIFRNSGDNIARIAAFSGHSSNNDSGEIQFAVSEDGTGSTITTAMTIDTTGNVGIGTTSPEQLLHLRSEAPFIAFTDSSNNSESGILYRNTSGTNVGFSLYDFANNAFKVRTNSGLALTINSAQVAIFEKTIEVLGQNLTHGASRIKISQESTALSEFRFYGADTSTAGSLRFLGSSSDGSVGGTRMTIASSGYIGIGNTAPTKELQVTGEISASSHIVAGGNLTTGGQILSPGGSNIALNPNTGLVTIANNLQLSGYVQAAGNLVSTGANAKISGSSSSTGSFGMLGIGVASPNGSAQINNSVAGRNALNIYQNASGTAGVNIINTANANQGLYVYSNHASATSPLSYVRGDHASGYASVALLAVENDNTSGMAISSKGKVLHETGDLEVRAGNISGSATSTGSFGNVYVGKGGAQFQNTKFAVVDNNSTEYAPMGGSSNTANAMVQFTNTNTSATAPHALIHFRLDKSGGDGYMGFMTSTSTGNIEHFVVGNQVDGELIRGASGGNVGIGDSNPSGKLVVSGSGTINLHIDNSGTGDTGLLGKRNATSIFGMFDDASDSKLRIVNYQAEPIEFSVDRGGSETIVMTMLNSGNVGIGETSPDELLHIKSSTASNPVIKLENAGDVTNGAQLHFVMSTTSEGDNDIPGTIRFKGMNSANAETEFATIYTRNIDITDGTEDSEMHFRTTSAGTLDTTMILQSGKVGIGTTSPGVALEVRDATANNGHIGGKINVAGDWNESNIAYGGNRSPGVTIQSLDSTAGTFGTLSFMNASGYTGATIIAKHVLHGAGTGNMDTQLHFGTRGIHNVNSGAHNVSAMMINEDGEVGIGTDDPGATLDIVGPSDGINLRLSDVAGDGTSKEARIGLRHYTAAEEDTALMYAQSSQNTAAVYIGGGTGVANAVETIGFVTAASHTTLSGTTRLTIDSSGNVEPGADNSYNLGAADKRWANIFSADLQLSNEGTEGNEVDGTTGSWTIQEGEDDLYLLNRKNGKKYKFKLEEIT